MSCFGMLQAAVPVVTRPETLRWLVAALTVLLFGLMVWLLPRTGHPRQGVMFGVTLPLEYAAGAEAQAALRRFRRGVLMGSMLVLLAVSACVAGGSAWVFGGSSSVGIAVDLLLARVLYSRERRKMLPHAVVVPLVRTAELGAGRSMSPLLWSVASFLPLAVEAMWLRLHWAAIPARWARHWNAQGVVNGWGTRTAAGVYGPLAMGVPMLLIFVLLVAFMSLASGAQVRERRRFLAPLAAMTWAMAMLFCAIGLTPFLAGLGEGGIALLVIGHVVLMLGIVVWGMWRSGLGQTESALAKVAPYDATPDAMWRAGGLIYYNPADAAVLVPKRMGLGWTLNFGRPAAWWYLGVVLALAAVSVVLQFLLGGGRR
jgi:uncharacterized membrane protein